MSAEEGRYEKKYPSVRGGVRLERRLKENPNFSLTRKHILLDDRDSYFESKRARNLRLVNSKPFQGEAEPVQGQLLGAEEPKHVCNLGGRNHDTHSPKNIQSSN